MDIEETGEGVEAVQLKALTTTYLKALEELKHVQPGVRKSELKKSIDDLREKVAWSFLDFGKYEEGLALYRLIPWRTHAKDKYIGMSRALTEMRRYDEARRLLEKALNKYPESAMLWAGMGTFYDHTGDAVEALKCYETALRFAPDNPVMLFNEAHVLMQLGSHQDALEIMQDLVEKYPEDPRYLSGRGYCALETGYMEDALRSYQKAMEIWKRNPTVYPGLCIFSGLCCAYLGFRMQKEAVEVAVEGLRIFPDQDSILYYNAAVAFYEIGWRQEARQVLQKGLEKFPADEDLKNFLKRIEDDMDDPNGGGKSPLLGIVLLIAMLRKKMRRR